MQGHNPKTDISVYGSERVKIEVAKKIISVACIDLNLELEYLDDLYLCITVVRMNRKHMATSR